ncbi:MAG: hypothetical protein WCT41_00475 [Candidatus Paceibacterota bacterium]|jgi:hypothetical protein
MKRTVFYSWQSDLPNSTNRTLIETALQDAAKAIASDENIDIEPVIDRDTKGAAGAPDIATTIFGKIASADLFVADISFVANTKKRAFPNPNVLIELGYALKAKGHEGLVLIFNEAYGKLTDLPFDLKMRRILTYTAKEVEMDKSTIKSSLTKDLKAALLDGFAGIKPSTPRISITDIIEQNPAAKIIHLRKHLTGVLTELETLEPRKAVDGGSAEELMTAISKTADIVADFGRLTETVAVMNDMESAREIFQWFGKLLQRYNPPHNEQGRGTNADGDFYKFVGHEMFTTFIAPFFKEEKWDALQELLKGTLIIGPSRNRHEPSKQSWTELSEHLPLLADESPKKQRKSLHADLLRGRHEVGPLSRELPFRDFLDIDFFLHLYGPGERGQYGGDWYPRSVLFLDHTPTFIYEAKDYPYAMRMCHVLGISDIDELKKRLTPSSKSLMYDRHAPFTDIEVQKIGSEGGGAIIQ